MATTQKKNESGNIRRQLGAAKRRLEESLQRNRSLLMEYSSGSLAALSPDQLIDFLIDSRNAHEEILQRLTKMQKLASEWEGLIDHDEGEIDVFETYITNYGDFRATMNEASTELEQLDIQEERIKQELTERGVDFMESSDRANSDQGIPSPFSTHPTNPSSASKRQSPILSGIQNYAPPVVPTQPPIVSFPNPTQHPAPPGITHPSGNQLPVTGPPNISAASAGTYLPTSVPIQNTAVLSAYNEVDVAILSQLKLPHFNGNILNFVEFWTKFYALVDSKSTLSSSTKFSLLKGCLSGDALRCIDGIPVSDLDYPVAISILHNSFYKPSTIRHILYSKIAALPICPQEGRQFSNFYLELNKLVRQFHAMDPTTAEQEYGLGAVIWNKLPRSVRSKLYDRNSTRKNLTPMELVIMLYDLIQKDNDIQLMEMQFSEMTHSESAFSSSTKLSQRHPTSQPKDFTTVSDVNRKSERTIQRTCEYCKSVDHHTNDCQDPRFRSYAQKVKFVKDNHLCFNCMKPNHKTQECQSKFTCRSCKQRHHTSLCPPKERHSASAAVPTNHQVHMHPRRQQPLPQSVTHHVTETNLDKDSEDSTERIFNLYPNQMENVQDQEYHIYSVDSLSQSTEDSCMDDNGPVLMMCTDLNICNPEDPTKKTTVTVFLDNGSTGSYISQDVAQKLGLSSIKPGPLQLHTFAAPVPQVVQTATHHLQVFLTDGSPYLLTVKSLPTLTNELKTASVTTKDFQQISTPEKNISSIVLKRPHLLIGTDHFWKLVLGPDFYALPLKSGLTLLNTRIGKMVTGKKVQRRKAEVYSAQDVPTDEYRELTLLTEKFWNLESLGIMDDPMQADETKCLQHFNSTIRYAADEERYYVKFPFKHHTESLTDNFKLCGFRLRSLWNKLIKDKESLKKYHGIIMEQLSKNIIESCEDQSYCIQPGKQHFLPHHCVITLDKKTTKVRIVYDGSAKMTGHTSINESLFKGPTLIPNLAGILLRIRMTPILISADVEKAFLMVGLEDEDREFTKFLWLKNPFEPPSPENLIIYRFRRVPFGLISSPFLLSATIHYHLMESKSPLAQRLLADLYVDNSFCGAKTIHEAKRFYVEAKQLFSSASMNLRDWTSNSAELNRYFEDKEKSKSDEISNVLGLKWNTSFDTLAIKVNVPEEITVWTKRKVLKRTATVFDPIGYLAPAVLQMKIFLQSLWRETLQWDEPIPENISTVWTQLLFEWKNLDEVMVPRLLFSPEENTQYSLHIFTDASKHAYGAVAYLRFCKKETTKFKVVFLISKTRLAPIKPQMTIPRLELSGVLMGSLLVQFLREELRLEITSSTIWTDSQIVVHWTRSDKNLPVFVSNRVRKIKEAAPTTVIRHVRGEDNPADLASRGLSMSELLNNRLWFDGPSFLLKAEDEWPETLPLELENTVEDFETVFSIQEEPAPAVPVDSTRFSSWNKLVNTTVIVLTFVQKLRKGRLQIPSNTIQLRDYAQFLLVRKTQVEDSPSQNLSLKLKIFTDGSGLLRSKGRIGNSNMSNSTIYPIYLPYTHWITQLMILETHQRLHHSGPNQVLFELRQQFWIPKGLKLVFNVIKRNCLQCRRAKAKPFVLPPFPDHPQERVTQPLYPFQRAGLDFIGPFEEVIEAEKLWICLITCLNSRAVYMEIVLDLSAHSLLHVIRRFSALYGAPQWIVCDNAPSFHVLNRIEEQLQGNIVTEEIEDLWNFTRTHRISFKFITPHSPWKGGVYERLVALVKSALKSAIHRKKLQIEEWRTLMKEVEATLNNRPLIPVNSDTEFIPLRPLDFIRPNAPTCPILLDTSMEEEWKPSTSDSLIQNWTESLKTLDNFWKRWYSEYLVSLRMKNHDSHHHGRLVTHISPTVGEVVLISDQFQPRSTWKLGIVKKLDEKDVPTTATVEVCDPRALKTTSGPVLKKELQRPINQLYSMELHSNVDDEYPKNTYKNTHHMRTRSKGVISNVTHLLSVCCILTLASESSASSLFECNTASTISRKTIYADNCYTEGYGIATYLDNNSPSICWFKTTCPLGHIRFWKDRSPNQGICGEECKCANWTKTCSHYTGPKTGESTKTHIPEKILDYIPEHICSFTPSSSCSSVKTMTSLPTIELFDETQVIVKDLSIEVPDFSNKEDVLCFAKDGTPVQKSELLAGTPEICSIFKCRPDFSTFCVFRKPAIVFFKDEKLSLRIPVKSWGHTIREYFPFNMSTAINHGNPDTPVVRCNKGGIQLFSLPKSFVLACISSTCVHMETYEEGINILFPTSAVMFNYKVSIQAWSEGVLILQSEKSCAGSPICEIIECKLCLEHLFNYQCWTWRDLLLILLWWIIMGLVYFFVAPAFGICIWTLSFLKKIGHSILCFLKKPKRPSPFAAVNIYSKGKRNTRKLRISTAVTIAVCLVTLVSPTSSCSDVTSFTADSTTCTNNGTHNDCIYQATSVVTLQPLGQETCLILRNEENQPVAVLSLKIDGVYNRCNKQSLFFTRDHTFNTESSHRCYWAGSCQKDRCAKTTPTDKLDEFTQIANRSPGYTACANSCQCISCNLCALCEPSCLFYRYYAAPATKVIYTIFHCPTWSTTVTGTATLRQKGYSDQITSFHLDPARPFRWNKFKITLGTVYIPPVPILSSKFISNDVSVAILPDSVTDFGLNTPGQLKCISRQDAEKFKCQFSSDTCHCIPSAYAVQCKCTDGNLSKYMKKNPLPLASQGLVISRAVDEIFATSTQGTSLQAIIQTMDYSLATLSNNNTCHVNLLSPLEGCYDCHTGAQVRLKCRSSPSEETAEIICQERKTIIRCSPSAEEQTALFHFSISRIHEECHVICPGSNSSITLEGSLSFVSQLVPINLHETVNNHVRAIQEDPWNFVNWIKDKISSLFSNYLHYFIITILALRRKASSTDVHQLVMVTPNVSKEKGVLFAVTQKVSDYFEVLSNFTENNILLATQEKPDELAQHSFGKGELRSLPRGFAAQKTLGGSILITFSHNRFVNGEKEYVVTRLKELSSIELKDVFARTALKLVKKEDSSPASNNNTAI